jgi:Transglutaminase-like superfamily
MTSSAPSRDSLAAILGGHLERLRRYAAAVPRHLRVFDVGEDAARAYFGLDAATLEELSGAGLPCVEDESGRRFAFADLHYLALRSGRPSAYRRGITAWANTFAALGEAPASDVRVEVRPQADADDAVVVLPARSLAVSVEKDVPAAVLEVVQRAPSVAPPPDLCDVAVEIGSYDFYVVPLDAPDRAELSRTIHAGDCGSVLAILREGLEAIGYECRTRFGLLLSVPYSTQHVWVEALVDDQWLALDPLMLGVMKQFGGLDEALWPPYRPLNATFVDISEFPAGARTASVVSSNGEGIASTFFTKISPHLEP